METLDGIIIRYNRQVLDFANASGSEAHDTIPILHEYTFDWICSCGEKHGWWFIRERGLPKKVKCDRPLGCGRHH